MILIFKFNNFKIKFCDVAKGFVYLKNLQMVTSNSIVGYSEKEFDFSVKYKEMKLKFFCFREFRSIKKVGKKWLDLSPKL
jgi:hypothetical protein